MSEEITEINWNEILEKFSTYKGVITHFCKENNIKPHQLFYQRKKLQRKNKKTFHAIDLNPAESTIPDVVNNSIQITNEIKIEIDKAKIYIPANEIALISTVIKELTKSC